MPQPTAEHLMLQMVRLSRATFDMRCAEALTHELELLDGSIDARAYGLLTGITVAYARPFTDARESPYGRLDSKWSDFPNRPDLKNQHESLIGFRNRLLAHNDATEHRKTTIMLGFGLARIVLTETRAPIDRNGVIKARELCKFQETRFSQAGLKLAGRLQTDLGWPAEGELDGDEELNRVRSFPERSQPSDAGGPETA